MKDAPVTDVWPHAKALREIRLRAGNLSAERAAKRNVDFPKDW